MNEFQASIFTTEKSSNRSFLFYALVCKKRLQSLASNLKLAIHERVKNEILLSQNFLFLPNKHRTDCIPPI